MKWVVSKVFGAVKDYVEKEIFPEEVVPSSSPKVEEAPKGQNAPKEQKTNKDFRCDEIDGEMVLTQYYGHDRVVHVPEMEKGKKITAIGTYAFRKALEVEEVTLPDTILEIQTDAFYQCENLKRVKLGNQVKKIGMCAFFQTSLEECNLPDSLEEMGQGALSCNLRGIVIPSKVTVLHTNVFSGIRAKELTIPGTVKRIEESAISCSENLLTVKIEEGVEYIGATAFEKAQVLETIMVPMSVTQIEDNAFGEIKSDITIVTPAGSYAEQFAKEKGIPYRNEVI